MILEGLSGTGKSSLPRAFADFMGSKTIEVPVQSSWKDRNDLLGFYNDFKKQYKETEFLKALYTATHDANNIYVIVLDEMNLSRIEYYFADLLSVLEKPNVEDWKIELISDYASISQNKESWPKLIHEGKLQISDNTWFVGTANKDDSTFIITDKVYDRSVVLNFDKKGVNGNIANSAPIQINNNDFQALLRNASRFKSATEDTKFHKMIEDLDKQVKDLFQITFGNRISNQLETFVPVYIECGGTVDEAVDIMFSRKILRKLEGIYDEDTKVKLDMLNEETIDLYENRFICSLTDRISKLVATRRQYYQDALKTIDDNNAIWAMERDYHTTASFQFFNKITKNTNHNQDDASFRDKLVEELKSIDEVEKKIRIIKRSEFYRVLRKKKKVVDPIQKTNILMFEFNYNQAYKLWKYLNQVHEEERLEDSVEIIEEELNDYYELYCLICIFSALHDIGFKETRGIGFDKDNKECN